MGLLNPFQKKEQSQQELVAEEREFTKEQNAMLGSLPAGAQDEQIFLEQAQQKADLIKWQQNLSPEAVQLIHDLKREVQVAGDIDKGTDKWKVMVGSIPMVNDLFVLDLISFARPYLSRNMMMSNYTEERILRNLQATLWSLRVHILQNRTKYDIHKTDMEYIIRLFKNFIDATPFRSLQNGERKYLGTIGKRIEMHTDGPPVKKKSLFGMGD